MKKNELEKEKERFKKVLKEIGIEPKEIKATKIKNEVYNEKEIWRIK